MVFGRNPPEGLLLVRDGRQCLGVMQLAIEVLLVFPQLAQPVRIAVQEVVGYESFLIRKGDLKILGGFQGRHVFFSNGGNDPFDPVGVPDHDDTAHKSNQYQGGQHDINALAQNDVVPNGDVKGHAQNT